MDDEDDEDDERQRLDVTRLPRHFSDESAAYQLLERARWPDGPVCPHCGSVNHAYFLTPQAETRKTRAGNPTYRRVWKCGACRKQFSVLIGTIFAESHIPLSKWLLALHLFRTSERRVSATALQRTLGIAYRSAWSMAHRIREAMGQDAGEIRIGVPATTIASYDAAPVVALRSRGQAGAVTALPLAWFD
jgi:transposase-like protein